MGDEALTVYTRRSVICSLVLLTGAICASVLPATAGESLFEREVAPLLQRRCLSCHQQGEAKGEFSFSTADDLQQSGYVDPSDVEASYLLELVTPHNGQAEMPKDAEPLSVDEIAVLERWIVAGADWPAGVHLEPASVTDRDWWSLQPLLATEETWNRTFGKEADVKDRSTHPVDQFLDRRLAQQGLKPLEQADPATLIRRLTYDLTGLPPEPADVQAFLKSSEEDAEKAWAGLVDRLLASPAFGEKWGQHWLDIARYAETHGYDKDKPRQNAWPYRDYVIRSFNSDKSYSRFVSEQVAGDVLYPDQPEGVVALGFLAAGPWDFIGHWEVGEGKLDGRIAKHLDRDEMVSAVFNVFMSTTVQCAQCHHHKFDPIRMEDYYRLHAVVSALDRADRVYAGVSEEQRQRREALLVEIRELKKSQQKLISSIERKVKEQASGIERRITEILTRYRNPQELRPEYGYHSSIASTDTQEKWVQVDLGEARSVSQIRIHPAFDHYNNIGAGFGFPVQYRVEAASEADFCDKSILLDATDADRLNPGTQTINVSVEGNEIRFVRFVATQLAERKNDYILALGEIEVIAQDGETNLAAGSQVTAKDSIESGVRWGRAKLVDGVYYKELTDEEAAAELALLREERTAIEANLRTAEQAAQLAEIEQQLKTLEAEQKQIPPGRMVYAAATEFSGGGKFKPTAGTPREIHLLRRGDLRSPAEVMTPGAPTIWNETDSAFASENIGLVNTETGPQWDEARARKSLAAYLTAEDNPLVWRSIANRVWLWSFGSPLVETSNDFGRGGMQPTHPQLLDYLAARLRDDPEQSLKSLVRLLVTSRAYRRSSRIDSSLAEADRQNNYYWRANRRRLTAEEFRDSLLWAAGLLDRTSGGPSFQDFVIDKPQHSPHYEYEQYDPADVSTHRRTVYRMVVRSQPQPLLTTLDCADPSISTPERTESTTALQALAAWNNRLVEYSAAQWANSLSESQLSADKTVDFAVQRLLGRSATPLERQVLSEHLHDHGPASLARVLFNLNAFIYLD
ncbi:MAG: hypothetical protein CMJ47_05495 [Planctomyces sp.]|nr:hypothetical protein [Planctomyces sp.]